MLTGIYVHLKDQLRKARDGGKDGYLYTRLSSSFVLRIRHIVVEVSVEERHFAREMLVLGVGSTASPSGTAHAYEHSCSEPRYPEELNHVTS